MTEIRTFCCDCITCFYDGVCAKQEEARVPDRCSDAWCPVSQSYSPFEDGIEYHESFA